MIVLHDVQLSSHQTRIDPDSSIVNPAAINITKPPQTRKEKVLKMNWGSSFTAAGAPDKTHRNTTSSANTVRTMVVKRDLVRLAHAALRVQKSVDHESARRLYT